MEADHHQPATRLEPLERGVEPGDVPITEHDAPMIDLMFNEAYSLHHESNGRN